MTTQFLECGGKRSATPLWILLSPDPYEEFQLSAIQSAVAAPLYRRIPKHIPVTLIEASQFPRLYNLNYDLIPRYRAEPGSCLPFV